jgi:hypothetical protein
MGEGSGWESVWIGRVTELDILVAVEIAEKSITDSFFGEESAIGGNDEPEPSEEADLSTGSDLGSGASGACDNGKSSEFSASQSPNEAEPEPPEDMHV